ncbi:isochorismate pyruvate lyase [Pararhizobium capsulatum DSM 1112]|uniref:chorismate mutase n=1 Tax=Pararhizobium capsulatum DSM 1112 TaxID=1121113 RepID=A0ABU0BKX5_9HYPH|nr:chorismate mutase family protein [Pararhizobium capsulatum]MDQ0318900.1 isochorismate pyruvate lyase [Pararhizobium capsulatum DSM 1112]
MPKTPEDCQSMTDIRSEIDRLDKALVALFRERFDYIGRAAEIKNLAGLKADIPARVTEVQQNARNNATLAGLDPDFYEDIWSRLVRHSIAHEKSILGETEGE